MASAMASAAAHSIPPPYTIPLGPRIRPPRLLPGTKAANTDPQPEGPPPEKNQVWVQGKWRNINSNAAKDRRVIQSRQTEKALAHTTHGINIYAYTHVRTNQVVYSLSRVMQNDKILPQLIFHGKKTVPAALRRDYWKPYFSLHFSGSPAGAHAGLKAYQRLRELATWRQLSPPKDFLIATEEDVKKVKSKYKPSDLQKKLDSHSIKDLPVLNQRLPQRLRAKKLMDQKASSVADAAFVLNVLNEEPSPAEQLQISNEAKKERLAKLSKRATRRLDKIREKELTKATQLDSKRELIQPKEGQLVLTKHAAQRIAMEYDGVLIGDNTVTDLEAIREIRQATTDRLSLRETSEAPDHQDSDANAVPEVSEENQVEDDGKNKASRVVKILWADIRDAAYAKQWSSNVYHDEVEPRAIVKQQRTIIRQEAVVDEDGQEISEQRQKILTQESSTPHIFGRAASSGWYESSEQLNAKMQKGRQAKLDGWRESKLKMSREVLTKIEAFKTDSKTLLQKMKEIEPEYTALRKLQARESRQPETNKNARIVQREEATEEAHIVQQLTDVEKDQLIQSMTEVREALEVNKAELSQLKDNFPRLFEMADSLEEWRQTRDDYKDVLIAKGDLEKIESDHSTTDVEARTKLKQVDDLLAALLPKYTTYDLADIGNAESKLSTLVNECNRKISALQKRLDSLQAEASTAQNETLITDIIDSIATQKRLISTEQKQVWEDRENQIQLLLDDFAKSHTDTTDLLLERISAERSANTEQIESIDAELKEQELTILENLLGLNTAATEISPQIKEYDDLMREKGIEQPPPKPEKKGIWSRVKGLVGR